MRHLILLASLVFAASLAAQETPTIKIRKTDKIDITIGSFGGSDGAAAARILKRDLELSGGFNVLSSGKAGFSVTGMSSGSGLDGKVTDVSGNVVLSKSYTGSARGKVHQFADDIVETLTGAPGIANTKIAFVATKTGRKEIYTADYDGSNVQQLTRDGNISVAPSLSPDGSRLVYTGYKSGYADVYEIELGSGARNRIIKFPGTNSGATFSPDGERLALTLSKDGNPELYVTGSGGGGARRLTKTRGVEASPTWSPDGDAIIYSSDDRGSPQLYRIGAGGGSAQPLNAGYNYCTEPNWSPDGKKVAFNVRQGGDFQVAVLDLAGGGTRIVGSGQDPVWGADSRHLLVATGSGLNLLDVQTGTATTVVSGLGKVSEPTWSR
jgi:TolB protein